MQVRSFIYQDYTKGWNIECPSLDCYTCGSDREDAILMMQELIPFWLEDYPANKPLPIDDGAIEIHTVQLDNHQWRFIVYQNGAKDWHAKWSLTGHEVEGSSREQVLALAQQSIPMWITEEFVNEPIPADDGTIEIVTLTVNLAVPSDTV